MDSKDFAMLLGISKAAVSQMMSRKQLIRDEVTLEVDVENPINKAYLIRRYQKIEREIGLYGVKAVPENWMYITVEKPGQSSIPFCLIPPSVEGLDDGDMIAFTTGYFLDEATGLAHDLLTEESFPVKVYENGKICRTKGENKK